MEGNMRRRAIGMFLASAAATGLSLTAFNARSAWIQAAASTCDIVSSGFWSTPGTNSLPTSWNTFSHGNAATNNNPNYMKVFCPVADFSYAPLSDGAYFNGATILLWGGGVPTSSIGQIFALYQTASGGVCSASGVVQAIAGFNYKMDLSIQVWKDNPTALKFIYAAVNPSGSFSNSIKGYTVY